MISTENIPEFEFRRSFFEIKWARSPSALIQAAQKTHYFLQRLHTHKILDNYCGPFTALQYFDLVNPEIPPDHILRLFIPFKVNQIGTPDFQLAAIFSCLTKTKVEITKPYGALSKIEILDALIEKNEPIPSLVDVDNDNPHWLIVVGKSERIYYVLDYEQILAISKESFIPACYRYLFKINREIS